MTREQIEAELRLFKSITLWDEQDSFGNDKLSSIEKGILYTRDVSTEIKEIAEDMYGLKPEQWNNTFHKSFGTVIDTPIEKLIAQQIIHYFTTYGLEALGIYDQDLVYIPHEKLEIPEINEDIPLICIHNITATELGSKIMTLLTSGIALSKQTIEDIMTLSDYIAVDEFDNIKNKEIRIALYDKYDITPRNNMSFLRYIVFKTTNSTLYIQSNDMIHIIKQARKDEAYKLFKNYVERDDGYKKLAEIFQRNKNIFLAFKTQEPSTKVEKELNHIINRLRKLSVKNHKPLKVNILDDLYNIKTLKGVEENKDKIRTELDKVSIFREIRIINGLNYRLENYNSALKKSIMYRIRNGKVYATELDKENSSRAGNALSVLIAIIKSHLINRATKLFKDKTFYIPENVTYTAPSSEKQFIGNIPEGSFVEIPRTGNMVVGVHWCNLDKARVDLDLKMMNLTEHYGWNVAYMSGLNDENDIVFSGDMTDAPKPNGATEVFLISPKAKNKSFLIKVNDFTQVKDTVPFEFIVAEFDGNSLHKDYVVDPNKLLIKVNNKFEQTDKVIGHTAAKTLGYVEMTTNSLKIYFKDFEDVKGRVSNLDDVNKNIFKYTDLYSKVQLTLNELIEKCGGKIERQRETETLEEVIVDGDILYKKILKPVDYDLSLENLTKESIIKIFSEV